MISPRVAPQVIGSGLLEAVPEATIRGAADPDDADGDGISGRPNTVWDESRRRAGARPLRLEGERGDASSSRPPARSSATSASRRRCTPTQNCPPAQDACAAAINGGEPELTDDLLAAVTFYGRTLSVPAMRDADDAEVARGAELFERSAARRATRRRCRRATADIAALADQEIHPVHRPAAARHGPGPGRRAARLRRRTRRSGARRRCGASASSTRSTATASCARRPRRGVAEAILWHGGEAEAAAEAFRTAPADDRRALVAFLEAL